jgi:hypothetical protein
MWSVHPSNGGVRKLKIYGKSGDFKPPVSPLTTTIGTRVGILETSQKLNFAWGRTYGV